MERFIQSFGGMLLHSLWQGMVLAIVAALLLILFRHTSAAKKYAILLGVLIVFFFTCMYTFIFQWQHYQHHPYQAVTAAIVEGSIQDIPVTDTFPLANTSFWLQAKSLLFAYTNQLVTIWFVIFLYQLLRTAGAFYYVQRIRQQHVLSAPEEWLVRFRTLSQQLQIHKPVSLLESTKIAVPVVSGYFKPVVLVPAGLLTGLPADQVEAVLLHELAHIRRHDYFINVLQVFMQTIFFFNPAFLWISSRLREQREHCCDDMAIACTRKPVEFIEALLAFKFYILKKSPALTFAAKKGQLHNRVTHILKQGPRPILFFDTTFFTGAILGLVLFVALRKEAVAIITPVKQSTIKNVPLDSLTVRNLTGAFNAGLDSVDYPKGRANNRTTGLVADGKIIPASSYKDYEHVSVITPAQQYITMNVPLDSLTLSYLTGEFNADLDSVHYQMGVANSRVTSLVVDGKIMPASTYKDYDHILARLVARFKDFQDRFEKARKDSILMMDKKISETSR